MRISQAITRIAVALVAAAVAVPKSAFGQQPNIQMLSEIVRGARGKVPAQRIALLDIELRVQQFALDLNSDTALMNDVGRASGLEVSTMELAFRCNGRVGCSDTLPPALVQIAKPEIKGLTAVALIAIRYYVNHTNGRRPGRSDTYYKVYLRQGRPSGPWTVTSVEFDGIS